MSDYLQPLDDLARSLGISGFPLLNARRLASGQLSLVIVLIEPCDSAEWVEYEVMVNGDPDAEEATSAREGCPTLQEIEAYIRWTTRDKYGLEDVSIFDINIPA
jgi:hypothetical protein